MTELTEVERLTKEKAKVVADLAAAVRLADQREHLLPRLEARVARLREKITPLTDEEHGLQGAITCIRGGTPTTYRLRKPRAKKPKGEGA